MVLTPLAAFRTDAASPRSPVTRSAPADISCRAASLSGLRVSALTRCPLDSSPTPPPPPPAALSPPGFAGHRLDAMSPGQQCARNRASLLAGSAGDQNASFGGHVAAPLSLGAKLGAATLIL